MSSRILYLLGVVAIGWAVTFALRALPFVIFAGKDRQLPPWVERFGAFVSPIIIGGLIIYAYTGLEWRTAWPYLAGLLTVGIQLWRHNPLISILAGTVLYMCLINCGCVTSKPVEFNAAHPAVTIGVTGVKFAGEPVQPNEVVDRLEDLDVPKDRMIHILLEPEVKDYFYAKKVMSALAQNGYVRSVLVTPRHSTAVSAGKKAKKGAIKASSASPKPIRYKRSQD